MTEDKIGRSETIIRKDLTAQDEMEISRLLETGLSYEEIIPTIKHLKQRRELAVLATHDSGTGVLCKSEITRKIHREIDRSNRHHHSATVFVLDIDGFKAFNDEHGHEVGDLILGALGFTLEESLRDSDLVGRIGGEEFAVLLPETSINSSKPVLERLAEGIGKNSILERFGVTLSVGCCGKSARDKTAQGNELLRNADAAMYVAKQTGKNRVYAYRSGNDSFKLVKKPFINYG